MSHPSSTVPFDDSVFSPFGPARNDTVFAFNVVSLNFLIAFRFLLESKKKLRLPKNKTGN